MNRRGDVVSAQVWELAAYSISQSDILSMSKSILMDGVAPVLAHILPPSWEAQVISWLEEDIPSFDWGGYVVGEVEREAFLLGKGKAPAVLAGVPFVDKIFSYLGCQ